MVIQGEADKGRKVREGIVRATEAAQEEGVRCEEGNCAGRHIHNIRSREPRILPAQGAQQGRGGRGTVPGLR
jgi:hypothetical protein